MQHTQAIQAHDSFLGPSKANITIAVGPTPELNPGFLGDAWSNPRAPPSQLR